MRNVLFVLWVLSAVVFFVVELQIAFGIATWLGVVCVVLACLGLVPVCLPAYRSMMAWAIHTSYGCSTNATILVGIWALAFTSYVSEFVLMSYGAWWALLSFAVVGTITGLIFNKRYLRDVVEYGLK